MKTKMEKTLGQQIFQDVLLFAFPNAVLLIIFICSCAGEFHPQYESYLLAEMINTVPTFFESAMTTIVALVVLIAILPITLLLAAIFMIMVFVMTPVELFTYGFIGDNWLLWLACIALIQIFISAYKLRLGEFEDTYLYKSGSHYELNVDDDGKTTLKKVDDYESNGFWKNIFLYLGRVLVVACVGIGVFIYGTVKRVKK